MDKASGDVLFSSVRDEAATAVLLHVLMRLREFSGERYVAVRFKSGRKLKLVEGERHLALLEDGNDMECS